MNEWAFIVTCTEVQAELQQSARPYIYRQDRTINEKVKILLLYKNNFNKDKHIIEYMTGLLW